MELKRFAAPLAGMLMAASPAWAQENEPAPPAGAPASFVLPAREADGSWRTPNTGVTAGEAAWHLRVALNVAALGCRGPEEARTVAGYNALLADHKAALAAAAAASEAAFQAKHGQGWRAAHDDAMTRLYNFWAQPPVQAAFCREAQAVLAEEATVEPGAFGEWTAASLRRLEAPFTAFYTAFDGYRAQLAAHRAAHAAPVTLAAAALSAESAQVAAASAETPAPVILAAAAPVAVEVAAVRPASFPVP